MCITADIAEEAKAYETLTAALSGDRDLAYSTLKASGADLSSPFPSYSDTISHITGLTRESLDSIWRDVREAFDRERIDYSIIPDTSSLFPESLKTEPVHYLYALGDTQLLSKYKVAFLGTGMPSLQGKEDTLKAVRCASLNPRTAVIAPLDTGTSAFALSASLKSGCPAIAVLSSFVSKCPSEQLMELMGEIYKRGLIISEFSPSQKREKWHVVYRNKTIAGIADAAFLSEEKDGGPSWAIFDGIQKKGSPVAISKAASRNPNYKWCLDRTQKGAFEIPKCDNIKKILPSQRKRNKEVFADLTPDLFS